MTRDQSLYRNVTSHLYFIKLYFIKSTIVTLLYPMCFFIPSICWSPSMLTDVADLPLLNS